MVGVSAAADRLRRDAFVIAQESCAAAQRAEREASEYLKTERGLWIRGLIAARLLAAIAYPGRIAYVRAIFAPAAPRARPKRPHSPETADQPGGGEASGSARLYGAWLDGAMGLAPSPPAHEVEESDDLAA